MTRYPGTLAGAAGFALFSAGSLGAGLLAVEPVLRQILGERVGLAALLRPATGWPVVGAVLTPERLAALPEGPYTAMVVVMGGLALLATFGAVANVLHAYLSLTVVARAITSVRREVFHRVLRLPLRSVVGGPTGATDIVSRVVNDTSQLQNGFNALLSKGVSQTLKGVAALAAALVIEWRVTLIALLVGPVIAVVIRKLGKRIRRASRAALESQARLLTAAAEALQGLRVVKAYATERYEAGRFHRMNRQVMRELLRVRTARALASPLVELLTLLALGTLVLLVAKPILDGLLDKGDFILAVGALGVAGASLKPLAGILNDIQASAGAADRIVQVVSLQPEPGHDRALPRLPRHRQSIQVQGVTFTYPNAHAPALRDVSVSVRQGEVVAFVGPNGSGKTTLLSLIPRLFDPDAGRVLVDGRDIRDFNIRSLRRQIGVVTQETVLFAGTIRGNIAYGSGGASKDQVERAARQAHAHDFIAALPAAYDSPVGEQGLTLSGGQRQRVAIARAILRDPAILLLDEATSMIDADSEAHIAAALADFAHGRTCLIVAHRLSTVMSADRIVVLDQGRIVDQGSHAELLDRCPVYRTIAHHQLLPAAPPVSVRARPAPV
ncbi:MAG: ABC transporter ATP-binding protein [Phycisphaerae bacterium]|nr:ABC transporter ATP-binding protein [Phycisphaerae bacterium]